MAGRIRKPVLMTCGGLNQRAGNGLSALRAIHAAPQTVRRKCLVLPRMDSDTGFIETAKG